MEEFFFKVDPETINQNRFSLSKSESKHLIKSLRSNIGDEIWLLDGLGVAYKGLISSINNNCVEGNIVNSFNNYGESKFDINLIIGLIKGKRMDLLLEKATELGVKSIQPLLLDRCIKTKLNYSRAEKIIISAAKQSGRSFFPKLYELTNLHNWLANHSDEFSILCHINSNNSMIKTIEKKMNSINIIVGPEGDFSENELIQLKKTKIKFVKLSSRRLRSESAAIVSIVKANQIMENQYE